MECVQGQEGMGEMPRSTTKITIVSRVTSLSHRDHVSTYQCIDVYHIYGEPRMSPVDTPPTSTVVVAVRIRSPLFEFEDRPSSPWLFTYCPDTLIDGLHDKSTVRRNKHSGRHPESLPRDFKKIKGIKVILALFVSVPLWPSAL